MTAVTQPISLERRAFLDERRDGIGGSDVGAIVGVDLFGRTARDVYYEKIGSTPDAEASNPLLELGRLMEPVIVQLYRQRSGRRVGKAKLRRHKKYPYMLVHPDGIIRPSVPREQRQHPHEGAGLLECKAVHATVFARIVREGIPQSYLLQMQHGLMVCGLKWGAFAILDRVTGRFAMIEVEADADLQADLVTLEAAFWQRVIDKTPPDETPVTIDLPPVDDGFLVKRDDVEWAQAVALLRESKELKATAAELEEQAKQRVKDTMQVKGVVEGAGMRVYWKDRAGRVSFDRKALEACQPLDPTKVALLLVQALADYPLAESLSQKIGEEARFDLSQFEKQGKSYDEIRAYPLREEQ